MSFDFLSISYLALLLISILGLGAIDFRHKLALWSAPLPTIFTVLIAVGFFLVWDVVGIANGIFFRGETPNLSGLLVAPELPLEEIFFLILLSYNTLIFYAFFERRKK